MRPTVHDLARDQQQPQQEVVVWKYRNPYGSQERSPFRDVLLGRSQHNTREITLDSNTGAKLWDAAYLAARFVHSLHFPDLRSASVLDLGAGTGLLGLACALRGANVTLSDHPSNVRLTKANVERNAGAVSRAGGKAEVVELDWTRRHVASAKVDYVVACECIYLPSLHLPLLTTMLAYGKGTALVVYKERSLGEEHFFRLASGKGVRITEVPREQMNEEFRDDLSYRIIWLHWTSSEAAA